MTAVLIGCGGSTTEPEPPTINRVSFTPAFRFDPSGMYAAGAAGDYAYCGMPGGLLVVDILDPSRPRIVSWLELGGSGAGDIEAGGGYLYAVVMQDVIALDIGDPSRPRRVGTTPVDHAYCLARSGDDLLAAGGTLISRLRLSDPYSPRVVSSCPLAHPTDELVVQGGYAVQLFLTTTGGTFPSTLAGLGVYELDPAGGVRWVMNWGPTPAYNAWVAAGDRVYFSHVGASLSTGVIRQTTILRPLETGGYEESGSIANLAGPMCVHRGRLYVFSDGNVHVLDLSDPDAPAPLGAFFLGSSWSGVGIPVNGRDPCSLSVTGDLLVAAFEDQGLVLVDLSQPDRPVSAGVLETSTPGVRKLAWVGDQLCVVSTGGWLRLLDIGSTGAMEETGACPSRGQPYHLAATGEMVLMKDVPSGDLQLFDVTNVEDPKPLGDLYLDAIDFGFSGGYLITGNLEGLRVLAREGPASFHTVAAFDTTWRYGSLLTDVDRVWVSLADPAESGRTLLAVDLSDPARPRTRSRLFVHGLRSDPVRAGNHLYAVGSYQSNYNSVFALAVTPSGGLERRGEPCPVRLSNVWGIVAAEEHLYLFGNRSGVEVFDLSDPDRPRSVGLLYLDQQIHDVAVRGRVLCLACSDGVRTWLMDGLTP